MSVDMSNVGTTSPTAGAGLALLRDKSASPTRAALTVNTVDFFMASLVSATFVGP